MMSDFPIIDLGAFEHSTDEHKQRLGAEVDRICRETGFLAISGHGVAQQVIEAVWGEARAFFDLPADDKQKSKAPYKGYPYGYLGPGTEALAKSKNVDTPPDLKESFNGGPARTPAGLNDADALSFCYAPTIWPARPEGFKAAWQNYYAAMEDLGLRIMRLFAVALKLDEHYFDRFLDAPISALRALNYPEQLVPPEPGQIRAGAHTDYGSLTILLPQAGSRGLEIMTPGGVWAEVPPIANAFIINIGDLMALWTNDRWVSTLHRVVNPPLDAGGGERRQSLAFFHQPNWDAEIAVLPTREGPAKYAPVRSGPYLMSKFRSTTK